MIYRVGLCALLVSCVFNVLVWIVCALVCDGVWCVCVCVFSCVLFLLFFKIFLGGYYVMMYGYLLLLCLCVSFNVFVCGVCEV